ncbi:nudix hydrolase 15, mitochondrial isoform X4 [Vigna angularis]|uniref:nudix hydrolase 15, mitochondrial isoform X4 n=1 Tax=Phaseolus angularis TaxID=3914 RepID=UPI0022B33152|nr:nudix hydrolase 15, mitochondrial isoform X4 [Vigna angularis]
MSSKRASSRLQALINHIQCSYSAPTNPDILDKPIVLKKRAAVLICLFEGGDGSLRVILTKRSSSLSTHSGEVALPGGKREEGDADDVQTALREAKEEIGLDPSLVSVITPLQPWHTRNDNRRAEEREWMEEKYLLHYFDYEFGNKKYVIWAITASILIGTATLLLQRFPDFLEQRPTIWGGMTEGDKLMLKNISNSK